MVCGEMMRVGSGKGLRKADQPPQRITLMTRLLSIGLAQATSETYRGKGRAGMARPASMIIIKAGRRLAVGIGMRRSLYSRMASANLLVAGVRQAFRAD